MSKFWPGSKILKNLGQRINKLKKTAVGISINYLDYCQNKLALAKAQNFTLKFKA